MIVSLPASPWFYRCLNAALLLVVAWLAAGLAWQIFSPRSLPPFAAPAPLSAGRPVLDMAPLTNLFASPGGAMQPSSLNLKLRGVIANSQPAAAVFERPGQSALAVRAGEEIEAGIRLAEVGADHVIVDNRGRRERLELDAKAAAAGVVPVEATVPSRFGPPPVAYQPAVPVLEPGERPPRPDAGGHGRGRGEADGGVRGRASDERSLSRQALASGMQGLNVADWSRGLLDAPGNGIVIENAAAQPLAGVLGLQSGDVLKSVNGTPLNRSGDVSSLYGAFSQANNVNIEILRNGTSMNLRYRIESQSKP